MKEEVHPRNTNWGICPKCLQKRARELDRFCSNCGHRQPAADRYSTALHFAEQLKIQMGRSLVACILFGSTVKGSDGPASDIDLAIIVNRSWNLPQSLLRKLISECPYEIQPLVYTKSGFKSLVKNKNISTLNILIDGRCLIESRFMATMVREMEKLSLTRSELSNQIAADLGDSYDALGEAIDKLYACLYGIVSSKIHLRALGELSSEQVATPQCIEILNEIRKNGDEWLSISRVFHEHIPGRSLGDLDLDRIGKALQKFHEWESSQ